MTRQSIIKNDAQEICVEVLFEKGDLDAMVEHKPVDGAWDICDDYLDPLAQMLFKWDNLHLRSFSLPECRPTELECSTSFASWYRTTNTRTDRLAAIWLMVNVSHQMAELVTNAITEADKIVGEAHLERQWPYAADIGEFLRDVARVLRERQGKPISRSAIQAEAEAETKDFFGPYTLADLTNGRPRKDGTYRKGLLEIGTSAFYDRVKKAPNKYRKGSGNTWFVHKTVLPSK